MVIRGVYIIDKKLQESAICNLGIVNMQIDTSHRSELVIYGESEYYELTDRCVSELSLLPQISSIVVCGSLAKGDLVPGWSDIDIIVFVSCPTNEVGVLDYIKFSIDRARQGLLIGIGLDIVYEDQFLESKKLCGRPYMMTYEVAGYGQIRYGKNPFSNIRYDAMGMNRVANEKYQLIAAEIHSWRRAYINHVDTKQSAVGWLFTCAKALLRILQCETGPNLVPPISSKGSLDRFIAACPNHPAIPAFKMSVNVRQGWADYYSPSSGADGIAALLSEALNTYPVLLPKE